MRISNFIFGVCSFGNTARRKAFSSIKGTDTIKSGLMRLKALNMIVGLGFFVRKNT